MPYCISVYRWKLGFVSIHIDMSVKISFNVLLFSYKRYKRNSFSTHYVGLPSSACYTIYSTKIFFLHYWSFRFWKRSSFVPVYIRQTAVSKQLLWSFLSWGWLESGTNLYMLRVVFKRTLQQEIGSGWIIFNNLDGKLFIWNYACTMVSVVQSKDHKTLGSFSTNSCSHFGNERSYDCTEYCLYNYILCSVKSVVAQQILACMYCNTFL